MARPKIKLDYDAIKKLAYMQCTQSEIASFCECSVDTLSRDKSFAEIYKQGQDNGRMSVRRWQFKSAEGGNTGMLIWLGKQYLGQRDATDITQSNRVDAETLREIEKIVNDKK